MLQLIRKPFVAVALITTVILAVVFYFKTQNNRPESTTVRIPLFSTLEIEKLDPAIITDAQQSNILRSIYATLLYFDNSGKLRAGAAERYDIKDRTIHFLIRKDIKTIDGSIITSKDVYLSFKRLLILNSNTHGRLADFLDCKVTPKKISDDCAGLSYDDNEVALTLKSANAITFFLPMLANPDYSILPISSVDYNGTLKILNYRNTSGAYYIASSTKEKTTFKVNPGHYLLSAQNPFVVEFINDVSSERIQRLEAGEFDAIPSFAFLSKRHISQIKDLSLFNVHKSLPIQLYYLRYTKKGFNSLSATERIGFAQAFKRSFIEEFGDSLGFENTIEYFTVVGEGSLNDTQLSQVISLNESSTAPTREVKIDLFNLSEEAGKRISGRIKYAKYISTLKLSDKETEKIIDTHTLSTDAGGIDNLSLLAYMQSTGNFNMTQDNFEKWMRDYIETADPNSRLEKFRELHFRLLKTAKVVPIAIGSYYAIARKPWRFEASQASAGTPLWTLKHE